MTTAAKNLLERQLEGARRYAAGEASDPWAYSRALCHIRQGLCGPLQDGQDGHYDAQEAREMRLTADGVPYSATTYRNRVRP